MLELSERGLTLHPDNIESWRGETEVGVGIGVSPSESVIFQIWIKARAMPGISHLLPGPWNMHK
jgi:hypothetical protein